jgi:putative flippase GtrA
VTGVWNWLHSNVGVRFTRFIAVAVASLATSEILLGLCDGVFHLSAIPTALISTLSGAAVSYVLSRWAWERTGRPDVLRETIPFWIISGVVWVVLTVATKLGYDLANSMHLHGARHVLVVGLTYFVANLVTFMIRFVIFHYVLFTDRTAAPRATAPAPAIDEMPVASSALAHETTGISEVGLRSDDARATRCREPRA